MLEPIFLMCSERCGSNLIRALMDAHSQVYAPMPIHLGRDFWYSLHRYGDLSRDENWEALIRDVVHRFREYPSELGFELTEVELHEKVTDREFPAIYRYVYEKGMKVAGKPYLFLKENHVHQHAWLYRHAFPDARFVCQVRDPRDYVLSCKRVSRYEPLYGSLSATIGVWRKDQEGALNTLRALGPDAVFVQRYEDLVREPETVLRALCGFLRIPFEASMLQFHTSREARLAARSYPGYWRNLARPILSDNVGKYRDGLSRATVRAVEHRLGYLMTQFGYERDFGEAGVLGRLSIQCLEIADKVAYRIESAIQNRKRARDGSAMSRVPASRAKLSDPVEYPYLN